MRNILPIGLLSTCMSFSVFAGMKTQLPLLGHGFNEETEEVLSQVLIYNGIASILYGGQQESSIQIKHDLSFEDLLTELNVKTSAGFSVGVFTIHGGVDFVASAAKTELSTNIAYVYDVRGKSALLSGLNFTELALALIKSRNVETKKKFFGSHFISQVDLGGKLIAVVSMNFVNKESKIAFHANFKMDILEFLKANAEGGVQNDQLAASASINISVKQIGGDPTKLSEIFRDSESGAVPVVSCSLKDLKPCHETLKAIIHYGQSFGEQLKNLEYNPNAVNGAAILGSGKADYRSHGLVEVDQGQTSAELQEVKAKRERLIKAYLQYSKDRDTIEKLLDLQPNFSERSRLEGLRKNIEKSISETLSVIEVCFEAPGICLQKVRDLHVLSYAPEELSFEWTFYNYCEFVNDSLSILETIKRVRKVFSDGEHLTCAELQAQLEKKKYLDLSFVPDGVSREISDLRPLNGLTQLRKIILDGNEIHSLSPLESNKNLETLLARDNAFTQFPEICEFQKLKHLDLEFNGQMNIEAQYDLECSAGAQKFPKLESINVRGAKFGTQRNVDEFVDKMEKLTRTKRYKTLFTSSQDVCEGLNDFQSNRGMMDQSDVNYHRKRNLVFTDDGISIPCSDKVSLSSFEG